MRKQWKKMYFPQIFTFTVMLFGFNFFPSSCTLFNYPENLIIKSVINNLQIHHCVLVKNAVDSNIAIAKNFSNQRIMMISLDYEKLIEYFNLGNFPNVATMIIIKEYNLKEITDVFYKFERLNILHRTHSFTWLVFVKSFEPTGGKLSLSVPYNCEFIISHQIEEARYELLEMYKLKNRTFFSKFGSFNLNQLTLANNFLYSRRMDLNGTVLTMDVKSQKSITREKRVKRNRNILQDTAKLMNFKYDYVETDFMHYRRFDIEQDVSELTFPMHSSLFKPNVFGPVFTTVINWYIKYPHVTEEATYFIHPFDKNLWCVILGFILLCSLVLLLIKSISQIFSDKLNGISWIDLIFIGLDFFCNQNSSPDLNQLQLRIIFFAFRFLGLFIVPAYGAVITSFLAVKLLQMPFRTLEEFVKNGKYLLLLERFTFAEHYFQSSNDSVLHTIYQNFSIVHDVAKMNISTPYQNICSGNIAIALYDNTILLQKFDCKYLKIPKPIGNTFYGILLSKNSPFKEVFNYNLIQFYSSGILNKYQSKISGAYYIIKPEVDDSLKPVEIQRVVQIFSIFFAAVMLSGIILLIEMTFKKYFSINITGDKYQNHDVVFENISPD